MKKSEEKAPARSPRERLLRVVQQLEALEKAKDEAAAALRDAFTDARVQGWDTATLKVVLKLRRMTPEQRKEKRALEAIYMATLGMLEGVDLPDEARRRMDEQQRRKKEPPPDDPGGGERGAATDEPARKREDPPPPPPPAQAQLPLKDPEEARQEGRDAAAVGKRIYDNPFAAGDPCRAAWDEGWCEQNKTHGMDTPSAFQRRKPKDPDEGGAGGEEGKGD